MANEPLTVGSERGSSIHRRAFVRSLGAAALAASAPGTGLPQAVAGRAGPGPRATVESAVARFYKALDENQKKVICFPCDHPKRSRLQNNWAIVEPTIGDLSAEQQAHCREVFQDLCSEDGYERFQRQMEEDYGGFARYHVALFGEPGTDRPFEWVLTGRHNTLRVDGNSAEGSAVVGPIFYGHASPSFHENARHTDNVWWYQAELANQIFQTLDATQRARALVVRAGPDAARPIRLRGQAPGETGLAVAAMDGSQKQMVRELLKDLTRPFRAFDVEEVQECLREVGGVDTLRLTYYQDGDSRRDSVRDVWKLEGPAFAWYFHGSPHVHAWVNLARPAPRA